MITEYELRILNCPFERFISIISQIEVRRSQYEDQKRYVYDLGTEKKSMIRLRHNGLFTTLAYKDLHPKSSDGYDFDKEVEVTVSSFQDTRAILDRFIVNLQYIKNQ